MKTKPIHGLLAATTLCLAGCANVPHAVLYQETTLGVSAGTNPESGNLKVRVGFKRDFASITPKVRTTPGDDTTIDAGSTFVASRYSVKGLDIPEVEEVMVTGEAAASLGKSPEALKPFGLK